MPHCRCSYCGGRRTMPRAPVEYSSPGRLPVCRTAGCEGKRRRKGKPKRWRVDRYRDRIELAVKPCTDYRCDYGFPHRRGSKGCFHNPRYAPKD